MSKLLVSVAVTVMALVSAGGATVVSAAAPAAPVGPTVSDAALKPMTAAKAAADAKRFDEVIERSNEVLAMPGKSAFDTFVAYQFLTMAYAQKNDTVKLVEAMQGQIDSGFPQGAEKALIVDTLAHVAYEAKNFAKAEEFGSMVLAAGSTDAGMFRLVGHSMYQQGKFADAARVLAAHVVDLESHGQVPGEQTLQLLVSAQDKSGDKKGVTDTLERMVANYPKTDYWKLVLQTSARGLKLSDRQVLQLYRLRMVTDTLTQCGEFMDMSDILTKIGLAAENQRVIEVALASKFCADKASQDALKQSQVAATNSATRARAELKDLETEAKTSTSGELDAALGSSLFGFGEYAKSAEVLSRGVGKGGIKNLYDAQILLGIAQLRAGDKAAAAKTFSDIKSDDAFNARLGRLWALQAR